MIIRSPKPEVNYTVIDNGLINDPNLDWREIGLLVYLLSKPDHWQISQAHLATQKKLGIDGIKAALSVLQQAGYVEHRKHSSGRSDWIIYDNPKVDKALLGRPKAEKPKVEKPKVANPRLVSTEYKTNTEKHNNAREGNLNLVAWEEFEQHRKSFKPALTDLARKKLINKIAHLPPDKQQACIDLSIENGWKGLFPEKQSNGEHGNGTRSKQAVSGHLTGAAKRAADHHEFLKREYAKAIAEEQGGEVVQQIGNNLQPPVDKRLSH